MKVRRVSENKIEKYYQSLQYLKQKLDSNEKYTFKTWAKERQMSTNTIRIIIRLGIVKNIGSNRGASSYYIWNDKIPVTRKLAKTILDEMRKYHTEYMRNFRIKNTIKKPNVKKVSKQINIPTKEMSTKKYSEIGLIRKFLKWIY